ncbi:MAG: ABC transporter permease [Anaerolineae bacterium]|jgi:putative ABC transport system permease protein
MRFADYIRIALSNLWKRKLRTSLTIFAVLIGAVLVALMVSLGVGVQNYVTAQLTSLGVPDVIGVEPASIQDVGALVLGASGFGAPQEVQEGQQNPYFNLETFTSDDLARIRAVPGVNDVQPVVVVLPQWVQLDGDEERYQAQLQASPDYAIAQRKLAAGRAFEPGERGVAVVAYGFLDAWDLENAGAALDKEITIRVSEGYQINPFSSKEPEGQNYVFRIVGVFQESILSTEVNVPLQDGIEMARYFNQDQDSYTSEDMGFALSVQVEDVEQIDAVAEAIEGAGDYAAETPEESAGALAGGFRIIQAVLSIFGLIALAVASLGIVNTLIMAIYERTREIGVMKALGASKGTIRRLFVVEAGSIGFWGGLLGVIFAWIAGQVINLVSHLTFLRDYRDFNISAFPLWLVLAVVALSTGIALLAGLLPANRAANLDPIEALRYE